MYEEVDWSKNMKGRGFVRLHDTQPDMIDGAWPIREIQQENGKSTFLLVRIEQDVNHNCLRLSGD